MIEINFQKKKVLNVFSLEVELSWAHGLRSVEMIVPPLWCGANGTNLRLCKLNYTEVDIRVPRASSSLSLCCISSWERPEVRSRMRGTSTSEDGGEVSARAWGSGAGDAVPPNSSQLLAHAKAHGEPPWMMQAVTGLAAHGAREWHSGRALSLSLSLSHFIRCLFFQFNLFQQRESKDTSGWLEEVWVGGVREGRAGRCGDGPRC